MIGTLLPLSAFLPWVAERGIDVPAFVSDLFANRISGFFAFDVIISAVVVTLFVVVQGARDAVPQRWAPVAATFLVGVSSGLPLFLALRERALRRRIETPGAG